MYAAIMTPCLYQSADVKILQMQGSSFDVCPICNKSVPKALLSFHASSCQPGPSGCQSSAAPASPQHAQHGPPEEALPGHGQHQASSALQQHCAGSNPHEAAACEASAAMREGQAMPQAVARSPPQPAGSQALPAKNAFAHMMQQQRERSQSWTFFLGERQDGSFYWHIWRDDRAPDSGDW